MDVPVLAGFGPGGTPDAEVATRVARAWLAGGIVGLPTETVYGLSADAQHPDAVARIYRVKGRPADHPLIVHVSGPGALDGWSAGPNEAARRLAEAFWPGPLTVVVARSARADDVITGRQPTVALRAPDHPVARACLAALVRESEDPARGVAAPSANRFGRVSPTRAADVVAEVGDRLDPARDLVVDGGPCPVGVESTIVDCTAPRPLVLRLGAISQAQVDAVMAGQAPSGPAPSGAAPSRANRHGSVPAAVTHGGSGPTRTAVAVRTPGRLESHYAPHAHVLLVQPGPPGVLSAVLSSAAEAERAAGRGLIAPSEVATPEGWTRLAAPESPSEYARDLYAALRRADELGLAEVVAVLPEPHAGPLALAVRDRLTRAAHRG